MRPVASERVSWAKMALVGVLWIGWTLANSFGNAPFRPMLYHILVLTLAVARVTASVEDMKAIRMNHQPPPHTLRARARPGRSGDSMMPLMLSGPNPVMIPQYVNTRKMPRMMIERSTERGTLRLGSLVSSA